MAVAASKNKYEYAPSRVYSYARTALAEEMPAYEPEAIPQRAPQAAPRKPQQTAHPSVQTRVRRDATPAAKRKQRFLPKLFSVAAVFITAAMLIYIIVRYASIADQWGNVTAMQANIEDSRRRITQLEVQLDEAADLEAAREAALAAGMNYPTAEQIVRVDNANSGGE